MGLRYLKTLRVVVSLAVFFFTLFLFIDIARLVPAGIIRAFLFLQFIPSLLTFLHVLGIAASGFIIVLLLTLLLGRVYCSFLCPMGVMLDIVSGIRTRLFRKKKPRYRKPQNFIRYTILAIAVVLLFFNSIFLINLLDPYGLSGKIFSNLARPAWYLGNNLLARFLKLFDNYTFYHVPMHFFAYRIMAATGLIFLALALLAWFRERWYCNVICPVGAVLGLASKFSFFKLRIDEGSCTRCGNCSKVCKSGCIDVKNMKIEFDRCVACYNCIGSCPEGGITYKNIRILPQRRRDAEKTVNGDYSFASLRLCGENKEQPIQHNLSRRNFFLTTAAGAGTIFLSSKLMASTAKLKTVTASPVTPPGSVSIWNFTSKCTACHLCVSSCPTKVLQPTLLEYGLTGILQPKMDYHREYCNFECVVCSEVCPTGAILPVTKEEKKTIQMGVSKFVKNLCVVVEKKTACGACSEHCPTKAVEMVPYLGELKIPQVDEKICVGCGACEFACPTRPERAIYVEANPYHRKAMKPMKKAKEGERKQTEKSDDFPF
jgi:ferredoxin